MATRIAGRRFDITLGTVAAVILLPGGAQGQRTERPVPAHGNVYTGEAGINARAQKSSSKGSGQSRPGRVNRTSYDLICYELISPNFFLNPRGPR